MFLLPAQCYVIHLHLHTAAASFHAHVLTRPSLHTIKRHHQATPAIMCLYSLFMAARVIPQVRVRFIINLRRLTRILQSLCLQSICCSLLNRNSGLPCVVCNFTFRHCIVTNCLNTSSFLCIWLKYKRGRSCCTTIDIMHHR